MLDFTTVNAEVLPPSRHIKLEFIDKIGSYYGFRFDVIGTPPGDITNCRNVPLHAQKSEKGVAYNVNCCFTLNFHVCLDCPVLETGDIAQTTSLVMGIVNDEAATWAGDTFTRCFNVTELSRNISLDFELSSLFLLTGVDTRGSANISGIQVEYGLSVDNLTTYYDDRLSTSVSRISPLSLSAGRLTKHTITNNYEHTKRV